MFRIHFASKAYWTLPLMSVILLRADDSGSIRRPLGVYAKVDIEDALSGYTGPPSPSVAQLHAYVRQLLAGLLANPAISGISVGQRWDNIEFADPSTAASYNDWSYLDDAFAEANAAHKSVQLTITPGFDLPSWLVKKIPSCDVLFSKGAAPSDCGTVTFKGYPQQQRSDGNLLPLPWNSIYQSAWIAFLGQLNARYSSNAAFVSIAVAGPVGASDEVIYPTNVNDPDVQPSGLSVDSTWAALIAHAFPNTSSYQNTDQVFIDQWKQTIDAYEKTFAGVTLFLGPDAGNDLPNFSASVTPHSDNILFAQDCTDSIKGKKPDLMSCEAKTEILSNFVAAVGPNGKATQVGGMTASSPSSLGDIGVPGVKLLTSLSPAPTPVFSGGADFDHPVSLGNLQDEGCPVYPATCSNLAVEEAAYNVLTVFFNGTPAATFYGGTLGSAPIQYLCVPYADVQWAEAHPCPSAPSSIIGNMSLQDLYNRASHDLFAMAGQVTPLSPLTCNNSSSPTTSLVANAEGESPTIAPNTWVEIKGWTLRPQETRALGKARIS
jgi:hypothetical protein